MGYNNREIEVKMLVVHSNFLSVERMLDAHLQDWDSKISGKSKDVYWKAPRNADANFVRVRFLPETKSGQLTLKHCDKETNVNRLEIDVDVKDPTQTVKLFTQLMGESTGVITKQYTVYFLDEEDTTISLYKVIGDSQLFIEVEARTATKVDKLVSDLKERFPVDLTSINKSLFDLFIKNK